MDPKVCFPQEGLPECDRGGEGGGYAGSGGGGARSSPGRGSKGAAKSLAALGGAGPGARSEPAAETRAYLLSERPGPGRGAAGGAHAGGSLVPSPFHCRRPQLRRRFRGVDPGGGGAGGARRGSSGCYG